MRFLPVLSLLLLLIGGCASRPVPLSGPVRGVEITTLQGSVTLAMETAGGSTGGRGYLFYRKPDNFRLTILSPFGQTVLELFVAGEDVTCLLPAKKQAWRGKMSELPENLGMNIWPLLQWVVEPPRPAGPALVRRFQRNDGTLETVYYGRDGLVQRKNNASGDEVIYDDYHEDEGIAVPWILEVRTAAGSRLKLLLDEPEVNRPLDEELLQPSLAGMDVLPLAEFRGLGSAP